ncbi:hypothetical protein [Nocardia sp. NPDC051463]|uniref:hypothetical protein n=1 Tax=Nocardia sp. NPDC051463 TaxID=3154845 RepID=UPI00342FF836
MPADHRSIGWPAGWISPIVVVDGHIAGTWEIVDSDLMITMFDGVAPPKQRLATAADHLAAARGQDLASVRVE